MHGMRSLTNGKRRFVGLRLRFALTAKSLRVSGTN
jgi:hypothetical protein